MASYVQSVLLTACGRLCRDSFKRLYSRNLAKEISPHEFSTRRIQHSLLSGTLLSLVLVVEKWSEIPALVNKLLNNCAAHRDPWIETQVNVFLAQLEPLIETTAPDVPFVRGTLYDSTIGYLFSESLDDKIAKKLEDTRIDKNRVLDEIANLKYEATDFKDNGPLNAKYVFTHNTLGRIEFFYPSATESEVTVARSVAILLEERRLKIAPIDSPIGEILITGDVSKTGGGVPLTTPDLLGQLWATSYNYLAYAGTVTQTIAQQSYQSVSNAAGAVGVYASTYSPGPVEIYGGSATLALVAIGLVVKKLRSRKKKGAKSVQHTDPVAPYFTMTTKENNARVFSYAMRAPWLKRYVQSFLKGVFNMRRTVDIEDKWAAFTVDLENCNFSDIDNKYESGPVFSALGRLRQLIIELDVAEDDEGKKTKHFTLEDDFKQYMQFMSLIYLASFTTTSSLDMRSNSLVLYRDTQGKLIILRRPFNGEGFTGKEREHLSPFGILELSPILGKTKLNVRTTTPTDIRANIQLLFARFDHLLSA